MIAILRAKMELRVNPERLSILQEICLWFHQHLYLCTIDNLPFYAFKCKKHGLVINYLKRYGEYLKCPTCFPQFMNTQELNPKEEKIIFELGYNDVDNFIEKEWKEYLKYMGEMKEIEVMYKNHSKGLCNKCGTVFSLNEPILYENAEDWWHCPNKCNV